MTHIEMINRWKIFIYILLALIAGIGFAGAFTHITYPCSLPYDDPDAVYCISVHKAVMHPIDLASNMQGSLIRFLLNFLVVFAIVLVLLIAFNKVWARIFKSAQSKSSSS